MTAYTYICELGHVDPVPSMGTYSACQHPVRVVSRQGSIGSAPCGRAIARVPFDPVLEAAFRVGGAEAAMVLIKDRAALHNQP